ncbi:MAG: hypothetical protein ABI613_08925 [Gemmatimonadota bacterium]
MPPSYGIRRPPGLGLLLLLLNPAPLSAQDPCPALAGDRIEAGWRAYRSDSMAVAERIFRSALALCPESGEARVGSGYIALRQGSLSLADSLFELVVESEPRNSDAWTGLALTMNRRGNRAGTVNAARRVVEILPQDSTARSLLDRLDPEWNRAARQPPSRPATQQVVSRTHGSGFQTRTRNGWLPFYIKGINLGAALPGKYPSEFPADSALYARWIQLMAGMNANAVRLYTILPPEFYRALRGWNLGHPRQVVWLIHGVWAELPPEHDFDDAVWKRSFRDEMTRVVDLVHGATDISPRPGHASGRYDADVSRWTLAYIIGREWEPYAIKAYAEGHPGLGAFRGRYLQADRAPAADRWMAEQCDFMLAHEMDRFNAIRPISYTSWPTLDPLRHSTESTIVEENAWREKRGRPENLTREYENDAVSMDANLIHPTAANPAGWFASYHAYPYYPDFMLLDPKYRQAHSSLGRSNYFGYLRDLKQHHADIPLVIAEYGVPSSHGTAHLQPQGWNHGGHDEKEMASIDVRLTQEIRESGAAGAILFAWIDEWFKKNWIVADFEIPIENTRRWHNVMDAEQNYGVLGEDAGPDHATPVLGGDPGRWLAGRSLYEDSPIPTNGPASLRIQHDASYIYLAVTLAGDNGSAFRRDSLGIMLALDTHLPNHGQHALPNHLTRSGAGFEFLIDLRGTDGEIRVAPEYNLYGGAPDPGGDDAGRFYHRPITIVDRTDGRFDSMYVGTNRARYGRDGTFYPASGVNRGRLRFGTAAQSSLSDWYYDGQARLIELRIPWALLNVSDPSTRTLVYERQHGESIGTVTAEGFRIGVVSYSRGAVPAVAGALPALASDGTWPAESFRSWQWEEWEDPQYHERLKPVYEAMKKTWARGTGREN